MSRPASSSRSLAHLTDAEAFRAVAFNTATKGLGAWTVALCLNRMSSGFDWRGCKKSDLRDEFAKGALARYPASELRRFMATATNARRGLR